MIIDFHTHIFPEKLAPQAIKRLEEAANIKAFADGTLAGLLQSMKQNNIDYSVVLPVVTKPSQFESVNRYAREITGKNGIISFGGIHPDSEDYKGQLEQIKEMRLPGIKLHPDYQNTFVDDPKMVRIIQYATELGLIVLLHAGMDIGFPEPVHCAPQRTRNMLEQLKAKDTPAVRNSPIGQKGTLGQNSSIDQDSFIGKDSFIVQDGSMGQDSSIIQDGLIGQDSPIAQDSLIGQDSPIVLAHTGGFGNWDEVEKYLVGTPVWFDISYSLGMIDDEQFLRIVRNHGANRILFATDSPWGSQRDTVEHLKKLPLTEEELDKIFFQNAASLLGLRTP